MKTCAIEVILPIVSIQKRLQDYVCFQFKDGVTVITETDFLFMKRNKFKLSEVFTAISCPLKALYRFYLMQIRKPIALLSSESIP